MGTSIALSPRSFATLADAVSFLGLNATPTAAVDADRIARALNRAIAWMERRTRRRLRATTYRDPVTVLGSWTGSSTTVTATTTNLKEDDDIVGNGLTVGSRIASVATGAFVLDRAPANATGNNESLTAGSAPFIVSGNNKQLFRMRDDCEWPVNAVYQIDQLDTMGTSTPLDLTYLRIDPDTGILYLPGAVFQSGEQNLRIHAHCGYIQPSGTRRGHGGEWDDLAGIQLRAAQVFHQDAAVGAGRATSKSVAGQGYTDPGFKMPEDIEADIARYARRG